ncbi:hypothetical protein N8I74_15725 [Chitiniphilus purpureus]|uniref:Uncharacterized protein n=1 Tax=Chitiniphilus purpureus TaxID=2981137 RepID=A0ABY6DK60_9NEIS|nr:hypothetical protein [Chitiniphilus sp. CD1]UXY14752.1 hypothetical protein N8I74_15725 [Chitiniphilus sp. CD1]
MIGTLSRFVAADTPRTGHAMSRIGRDITVVQITVSGTGAVSASGELLGSNDGVAWVSLGTLSASGTTLATYADYIDRPYEQLRFDPIAISGTGAVAIVTQSGVV